MKIKILYLLAATLLVSTTSAIAMPLTISFTGQVTSVGTAISGDGVNVGDVLAGQFIYDTSAVDLNSNPNYGSYGGQSFNIVFSGGFFASAGTTGIYVQNDQQNGSATNPADGLRAVGSSVTGFSLNGRSIDGYQFGLRKENLLGDLWADDALPDASDWAGVTLADINAPDWHWMQFQRYASDDSIFDSQIRWDITSFSYATRVPEPATLFLLGTGLAGIGLMKKRQRSQKKII